MATYNLSHHESGGVVLFTGELILLFCDDVNIQLPERNESETGRLFLTTHRIVFINKSLRNSLKSFSAPFYSMHDLHLEQPIFGANYIKGKVKEQESQRSAVFKLKFVSGGAIEYGQALRNASSRTQSLAQQFPFQPPPAYTPGASAYYQAPPNVYQPAYNCGFNLPTNIFSQAPPAGFIFTSEAPPPYPGLNTPANGQYPNQAPNQNQPGAYPTSQPGSYPGPQPGSYPGPQPGSYPGPQPGAYPTSQPGSYPAPPPGAYPTSQPGSYPTPQPGFFPLSQNGYNGHPGYGQPPPAYPGPQADNSIYPSLGPSYPPQANGQYQQSANPNYPPPQPAYPQTEDPFSNANVPVFDQNYQNKKMQ